MLKKRRRRQGIDQLAVCIGGLLFSTEALSECKDQAIDLMSATLCKLLPHRKHGPKLSFKGQYHKIFASGLL
jgi:hypothetical protein